MVSGIQGQLLEVTGKNPSIPPSIYPLIEWICRYPIFLWVYFVTFSGCSCWMQQAQGYRVDIQARSLRLPWICHNQIPHSHLHWWDDRKWNFFLTSKKFALELKSLIKIKNQMEESTRSFKRSPSFLWSKAFARSSSPFGTATPLPSTTSSAAAGASSIDQVKKLKIIQAEAEIWGCFLLLQSSDAEGFISGLWRLFLASPV